jgi:hypothetical protein
MIITAAVAGTGWWMATRPAEVSPVTPAVESAPAVARTAATTAPAGSGATAAAALAADAGDLPTVTVYKSPTCGCCKAWIEHLEENGFTVEAVDTQDMMTVKAALGMPDELGSCHTAVIGDYLVEGHVPADDIKSFLAEAPADRGLSAPGMPVGSPGMEVEGQPADRYDVIAFDERGGRRVYRSH